MVTPASLLFALSALCAGAPGESTMGTETHGIVIATTTGTVVRTATGTSSTSCPTGSAYADRAAAWGVAGSLWPIGPTGSQAGNASYNYNWMYSVQDSGLTNVTLNVPPGSPLPDGSGPWSICYVAIDLPLSIIERAQTDNGSCRTALGGDCVDGLKAAVAANLSSIDPRDRCISLLTQVDRFISSDARCSKVFANGTGDSFTNSIDVNGSCPVISNVLQPGYTLINAFSENNARWSNPREPLFAFYNDSGVNAPFFRAAKNVQMLFTAYISTDALAPKMGPDSGAFYDVNCLRATNFSSTATRPSDLPSASPLSAAGLVTPQGSVFLGVIGMTLFTIFTLGASVLW